MCIQIIGEMFANAIGLMLLGFFGFIILFYLTGFLIGAFIGGVALLIFAITNPLNWIFLIVLILGGCLLLNR
ncbi:MAG: hypothetical protein LLF83_01640 [Methanobacterium sp.]|nr:hypothetical protein [Methanobacterium sp.]